MEKLTDIILETLLNRHEQPTPDLERLKFDRIRQAVPVLKQTVLRIDLNTDLLICCTEPYQVDQLLAIETELKQQVYLMLGCWQFTIWFAGEQLRVGLTRELPEGFELPRLSAEELESIAIEILEESEMVTATLERPAIETNSSQSTTNGKLPGQNLASIAADVEQSVEAVRSWLEAHQIEVIPYAGEEIVSGEGAMAAFDYFEPLVIQQRRLKRGLPATTPVNEANGSMAIDPPSETPDAPTPTPEKPKATRKSSAAKTTTRKPAAKKSQTRTRKAATEPSS